MTKNKETAALSMEDFIKTGDQHYLTGVVIDCVIFGYHNRQLKVLLAKYAFNHGWGFPGGFIKKEEALGDAATRILKERTSLDHIFLQQFHTFGDTPFRVNRNKLKGISRLSKYLTPDNWLMQRTLAIGYYALIDYSRAVITHDELYEEFQWFAVNEIPALLFDHNDMAEKALTTLRKEIFHQPIGYNLLQKKFTLPEIQVLYETILGKPLERRNFPKKLLQLGIIEKLEEKKHIGQHRAPFLYKFNKAAYEQALRKGVVLVL